MQATVSSTATQGCLLPQLTAPVLPSVWRKMEEWYVEQNSRLGTERRLCNKFRHFSCDAHRVARMCLHTKKDAFNYPTRTHSRCKNPEKRSCVAHDTSAALRKRPRRRLSCFWCNSRRGTLLWLTGRCCNHPLAAHQFSVQHSWVS